MKNKTLYFLFAFIASPEFIIILIFFILWRLNVNTFYLRISELIFSSTDLDSIIKQIGIPIALIGISFSQFKYILQPETDLKKFYNWPDYIKLKTTYLAGLIWNIVPIISTCSIIFVCPNIKSETKGFLFLAPLISSIISTITIILARQKLKEIIEKSKNDI